MRAPALPDKPSFTIDEVAVLIGFPKRVLQDACRKGRVRHQHLGRQRTFTRDQLLELFMSTEVGPEPNGKPRDVTPEQERLQASRGRALSRVARKAQG
jgi:excisionase family DNA binding protein